MKKMNVRADLSSSEEDEASANILKEAIDQHFLNDDPYSVKRARVIPSSEAQTNKLDKNSLRTSSRREDGFVNFGVTAAFRSFIAKKLDEILERSIENSESINCYGKQKRRRSKSSGIKLLSTSNKLLTVAKGGEDCTEYEKKSKRSGQTAEDDEDEEALSKFREAAVDPECILSKKDTEAWVNKRPESEFKYKRLKNDTLIEM